jgi:transposase
LTGANPVDRGKAGSKYHLLIDAGGLPLAVGLSAANTHDSLLLEQLVDAVPAVIGATRSAGAAAQATGQAARRQGLRLPGLPAGTAAQEHHPADRPPRGGVQHRLGRHRWKVERSLAWLLANRRLTIRYERRGDLLTAFLHLACALICARKLVMS